MYSTTGVVTGTAASGTLAFTGVAFGWEVIVAVTLISLGLVLTRLAHRRSREA